MKDDTRKYCVVQFDDGIQIIPQNWFVDVARQKAYWPNYTNFKTYDKAVESMQDADVVNWRQETVREIIATSDSFQSAKDKLKRAEMVADVNTDTDESRAKKQRRINAAKRKSNSVNSESEEEDAFAELLPTFPRQPIVRQRSCGNDSSLSAYCSKSDTSSRASSRQLYYSSQSQLQSEERDHSPFSDLSRNNRQSPITKKQNINNTYNARSQQSHYSSQSQLQSEGRDRSPLSDLSRNNGQSPITNKKNVNNAYNATSAQSQTKNKNVNDLSHLTNYVQRNNICSHSENESTNLAQFGKNNYVKETAHKPLPSIAQYDDASFKKYVIKMLTDIKYKLNIIIANQNDERDVCTTCQKYEADEKNEEGENSLISMFPIKNDKELQTLETYLMDEQNRAKLIKHLRKLGGQNIKHTVQSLLKKCFTYELAQTFSWLGRRKKKKFSELRFCTIVIDIVQKHYPDATNASICIFIKEWLRRAPEKCGKGVEAAADDEPRANNDEPRANNDEPRANDDED